MATVVEEIVDFLSKNSYNLEDKEGNYQHVISVDAIIKNVGKWFEMEKQQNIPVREELLEALGMNDEDYVDYLKGANNYAPIGSKLKVVFNNSGHEFKIGEEVVVVEKEWDDCSNYWRWYCENNSKSEWALFFEDFELIS